MSCSCWPVSRPVFWCLWHLSTLHILHSSMPISIGHLGRYDMSLRGLYFIVGTILLPIRGGARTLHLPFRSSTSCSVPSIFRTRFSPGTLASRMQRFPLVLGRR